MILNKKNFTAYLNNHLMIKCNIVELYYKMCNSKFNSKSDNLDPIFAELGIPNRDKGRISFLISYLKNLYCWNDE